MALGIIGMNIFGAAMAAVAAQKGTEVVCTDLDEEIVKGLAEGELPGYERGLEDLFNFHARNGLISITENYKKCIEESSLLVLTYETIERDQLSPDLGPVEKGIRAVGRFLKKDTAIILTGLLPPGTAETMEAILNTCLEERETKVKGYVVAAPQNLPYGQVLDTLVSNRHYTFGCDDPLAIQRLMTGLAKNGVNPAGVQFLNRKETELNAYLKIILDKTVAGCLREMIRLSEHFGCDTERVMASLANNWQKPDFTRPALPTGTPESHKLRELVNLAAEDSVPLPLLEGTVTEQEAHVLNLVSHIQKSLPQKQNRLLILGLTPNGGTDQLRDSPTVAVINALADEDTCLDIFCKAEITQLKWRLFKKRDVTRCVVDIDDLNKTYDALVILGRIEGFGAEPLQTLVETNPDMKVIDPYRLFKEKKGIIKNRYCPSWI